MRQKRAEAVEDRERLDEGHRAASPSAAPPARLLLAHRLRVEHELLGEPQARALERAEAGLLPPRLEPRDLRLVQPGRARLARAQRSGCRAPCSCAMRSRHSSSSTGSTRRFSQKIPANSRQAAYSSGAARSCARSRRRRDRAREARTCAQDTSCIVPRMKFGIFFELSVPRPFEAGIESRCTRTRSSRRASPTSSASTRCGRSSTTSSRSTRTARRPRSS